MASSSSSSSSSNHKKKHVESKSMEMEEIVRYMSNLPSYLERGKPVQDRALNFGVLDWGRLEQWQYHHYKPSVTTNNSNSSSGSASREKATNQSRTKSRSFKTDNLDPQDLAESRSSDDTGSFQTASSSSSSSKGKMKIEDPCLDPKNEIVNRKNTKTDPKAEIVNRKNSKAEAGSKDFDFKTGSKNLFSFSMSSKLASTKSAPRTLEPPPVSHHPPEDSKVKAKVKMDLGNCKEVKVDNSCRNKIKDSSSSLSSSASSSVSSSLPSSASSSLSSSLPSASSSLSSSSSRTRALLHMTVKAGRPLFTFTVDEKSTDILAATVTPLTGKDDKNSWVYTFFTIHEVKKKKTGWVYRSTKDNGNGYLSNVTARMTVSNPSISNGATREFVLTSVDSGHPGQPDEGILDVELEHELAAIVVRFLTKSAENENGDCFSAAVVLPGGHHSVPRKGEPSPLIERWRSGGRCDCGGWDVGCRLRTLTNSVQASRRSNPPESFDLFLQGDVINERPFFSLSPIKEGIFSVSYSTSLPLLQAFSISISVIECRKSSRHMELKTYVAKQVDEDAAPVTYVSLPPVSPVGRV